jgi:hypothetical protein
VDPDPYLPNVPDPQHWYYSIPSVDNTIAHNTYLRRYKAFLKSWKSGLFVYIVKIIAPGSGSRGAKSIPITIR